jgi:hypothetical protein
MPRGIIQSSKPASRDSEQVEPLKLEMIGECIEIACN